MLQFCRGPSGNGWLQNTDKLAFSKKLQRAKQLFDLFRRSLLILDESCNSSGIFSEAGQIDGDLFFFSTEHGGAPINELSAQWYRHCAVSSSLLDRANGRANTAIKYALPYWVAGARGGEGE